MGDAKTGRTWWTRSLLLLALAGCAGGPNADDDDGKGNPAGPLPGTWRPFSDDSPWNTPIGDAPELAPDSAALIEDFRTSSPFGEHLDINIEGFTVPLFVADASTPRFTMRADLGGQGWGAGGENAALAMPIPDGAAPDPQSDHHFLVVDGDGQTEFGCWNTTVDGDGSHAGVCAATDLTGTGVRPRSDQANPWWDAHGARACGFPLVAGLIRAEEVAAGHIDHALVVAYPHIRAGYYTPPASTAQANNGTALPSRGIPCGGRIQLDPTLDVDSLDLGEGAKIVLRALQDYGAFVADSSGALTLYADGSAAAQLKWSGVLSTDDLRDVLDLSRLRVLKLGALIDNGNGG